MKKKHEEPSITLQVVSAEVAGLSAGGLYTDGINFLRDNYFKSVGPVEENTAGGKKTYPHRINGIAPDETTELFVIITYTPNERMMYMQTTISMVNRQSFVALDSGTTVFKPDKAGDRTIFEVTGKMGMWRVTAKVPSAEVMAKVALFANGKKVIKIGDDVTSLKEALPVEGVETISSFDTPIERAKQKSPKFAVFLGEHCEGVTKIMVVSDAITAYLKREGMSAKRFSEKFELSPVLCYNLISLQNLRPDLRPALEIPRKPGRGTNKDRLAIDVGARLSEVAHDEQVSVWKKAKALTAQEDIILEIVAHARKPLTAV